MVRSVSQAREEFTSRGISISNWARENGFSVPLVYQVLNGERKAIRGQSHDIAVALGLKEGDFGKVEKLPFRKR